MLTLSPREARNTLATVHGFESLQNGIEGTMHVFQRLQCVQSDPMEVAGRNADLTVQSRVSDYKEEYLYDLLYRSRHLFEYYCKAFSIQPMDKYPLFHWLRTLLQKKNAPFFKKYEEETRDILKMMEEGTVSSRDFTKWKPYKERDIPLLRLILGRLWACGRTAIHHREGAIKYYGLIDNIIPQEYLTETPEEIECIKGMVRIIVNASRLVSPSRATEQWHFVGETKKISEILEMLEKEGELFELTIQGHKGKLYAPVENKDVWEDPHPPSQDYVRFLAPLDPLIWSRTLFKTVYDLDYFWEAYKKPKDRIYGYYCLPILFNGEAVGLIEPFFRKRDRTLEIRNLYVLKKEIDENTFKKALEAEIQRFSVNLGAEALAAETGGIWLEGLELTPGAHKR